MCDCKDCGKEAKPKVKKVAPKKRQSNKEAALFSEIFKVHPANGDIVCIVSPAGPLKANVMTNIKQMLDGMGLNQCIVLCLPDSVTIQTFDGAHEDLFAAVAGQAQNC